jgi:electron transfer flavoprotein alpha/beta subunit
MNAFKKKIIQWNIKDIGADSDRVGSLGSPTYVERVIPMEQKREGLISGDLDEAVKEAVNRLKRFL